MRMRLAGWSLFLALALVSVEAQAFVPPHFDASRARTRNALMGEWRVVTSRIAGVPQQPSDEIGFFIGARTIRKLGVGAGGEVKYEIVEQEADLLVLRVTLADGSEQLVDALVESANAVTLYVTDDAGDDEEVLRLERVP